ncbi:MAG TPA: hypothetical protein RMH99_18870 [Sandaracinaceae bacterium LLY-WYZ-13_1]|nr:hypothetical protein [Sandaracinaceae bacterium LLY-WYZ-13_1]
MKRIALLALAGILGLTLAACGDGNDDMDAGTDGGDAGSEMEDSGSDEPDAFVPDAGPMGCQEDCEVEQLSLGILHSCALRANGEVICWGRAQELQLGDNRTRHEQCAEVGSDPEDCSGVPVNVRYEGESGLPVLMDATQISTRGFGASCALRAGGELWCWSLETIPEVAGGMPRQRPVAERDLATLDSVEQVSASDGHICVVHGTDRRVLCAGSNSFGQLGLGTFGARVTMPTEVSLPDGDLTDVQQVEVSHGAFTCARTSDTIYCWGVNDNDQFGDGVDTSHAAEPCMGSSVTDVFDCSNEAVEVGEIQIDETTSEPLGPVSAMTLGSSHVCVVRSADGSPGQVYCWGDNRGGQGAQPDSEDSLGYPTAVDGIDDAVDVAAGSGFTCALHDGGTISCWGSNLHGQLGDGVMDHGATCERGSDDVDCSRTPVSVETIDDAIAIGANASHACAIRANGSVWCWGRNNNKQLGTTDRMNRYEPVMVQGTDPSM